jgi:hypothetical protein
VLFVSIGHLAANDGKEANRKYRGGGIRFAGFFVTNINSTLQLDVKGAPIGTRIDVTDDLGVRDSATIPKINMDYRFSKRSRLDLTWFDISRSGQKQLEKTIQFNGEEFTIGTEVDSFIDTELFSLQYTWVYYESDKVLLGLSAGLTVMRVDVGISTSRQEEPQAQAAVTAPLPAFGLRMAYRVTPKLSVLVGSNLFMIEYGDYKGSFVTVAAAVEHHTFKRVGFGGSLERLALDLQIDESSAFWDINHVFTGYSAYVAVYF